MKNVSWLALFLLAGSALVSSINSGSGAEAEDTEKSIFNGKDLTGWDGNPKLWSVQDGAIVGETTAQDPIKGNTFLIWTNGPVGDFELRCQFKIIPNNNQGFANSGIQYRSKILDPKNWVVGGYQADMEAGDTYTGILYEERMSRAIMADRGQKVVWDKDCKKQVTGSLGKSEEIQAAIRKRDWNDYVIIAKGFHFQHFINGKQTVDVTDDCESKRATSGVMALQLHAGQAMRVEFKNLRLKQAPAPKPATAAEDLHRLQGTWQVVSAEAGGKPLPSAENLTNILVVLTGNSYRTINRTSVDRGTFTLDPSQSPKQMDIKTGDGEILLSIYEVGPDSLRVCYARDGAERPSGFATNGEEPRWLLIDYKRKKD